MNELTINVRQDPGIIELNFDEIEKALDERLAEYKGAVFTEESKTWAKKEVASLRKFKEKFETVRKSVKKEWMKPYDDFEKRMKALTAKIDEPINLINDQVAEFERKRKKERRRRIREIYDDLAAEISEYCPLERIYDKRWENATTTEKAIREAVSLAVQSAEMAVNTISAMQSEAVEEGLKIYRNSGDMAKAVSYINNYERQRAEIMRREEERRRREEDRKRQEEEERIRREERERIERENRIREEAKQEAAKEAEQIRQEQAVVQPFGPEDSTPAAGDEVMPFSQPDTKVVFYRIVATEDDIRTVETALDSIGVYYERRDG